MAEKTSKRKFLYSAAKYVSIGTAVYYAGGFIGGILAASYEPPKDQQYSIQSRPTRAFAGSVIGSKISLAIYSLACIVKARRKKKSKDLENLAESPTI